VIVSVLQQTILDVGFHEFNVASLGVGRVFLYVLGMKAVMDVCNNAAEFYHEFLYDCRLWSKNSKTMYERGVWVTCYEIPLHAWNDSFLLKLRQ